MKAGQYIKCAFFALVISIITVIPIAFILLLAAAVTKIYISGNNYALHQRLDTPFLNMPGGSLAVYDLIFLTAVLIVWVSIFSIAFFAQIHRFKRKPATDLSIQKT